MEIYLNAYKMLLCTIPICLSYLSCTDIVTELGYIKVKVCQGKHIYWENKTYGGPKYTVPLQQLEPASFGTTPLAHTATTACLKVLPHPQDDLQT